MLNTLPRPIYDYITAILPTMDGWCTPEKATKLAARTLATYPRVCVEIGVYAGRSLFAIALALKELGGSSRILGIDPWSSGASCAGFEHDPANRDWWNKLDHGKIYAEFDSYRTKLGVANCVDVFVGTSRQAASLLEFTCTCPTACGRPFIDLLHIDGNHSEATALLDVNEFVPLVRTGGTIVMDDLDWSTTKAAQVRLGELCLQVEICDQADKGVYGIYTRR